MIDLKTGVSAIKALQARFPDHKIERVEGVCTLLVAEDDKHYIGCFPKLDPPWVAKKTTKHPFEQRFFSLEEALEFYTEEGSLLEKEVKTLMDAIRKAIPNTREPILQLLKHNLAIQLNRCLMEEDDADIEGALLKLSKKLEEN